jgi:hypothetical protein
MIINRKISKQKNLTTAQVHQCLTSSNLTSIFAFITTAQITNRPAISRDLTSNIIRETNCCTINQFFVMRKE